MTMTDEKRKALTEYLGECFHEKIEPMNTIYPTIMEATLKLNEVIEKMNLIMEYLNKGVKK